MLNVINAKKRTPSMLLYLINFAILLQWTSLSSSPLQQDCKKKNHFIFSLCLLSLDFHYSLSSFSFSSLFHRFLSSLSFFFLSHWFFLFLPLSNPLALALSCSSLTLSLVSHGCKLQCFGGHCGSHFGG